MRTRSASPLWLVLLSLASVARAEVVDRVVLRVNGEIATLVDYEQRKNDRVEQITHAAELSIDDRRKLVAEAGRATMKELFEELLVLSRAHQLHVEVTPAQVDRAVDNSKRRFGIESDADFEQALAQSGLTLAEYRQRASRSLLLNTVFEREVQDKAQIDDEAVARYWHDHASEFRTADARRVEEVVVRDDAGLAADARSALAAAIAGRAAAGAPLAEAARDAGGGDAVSAPIEHGWIEAGTLAAELERAIWSLPAGGVSAPVAGRGGLHVLRVLEVRAPAPRPLDEVKEEIRARLGEEKFQQRLKEFLAEQAANAYVIESLPEDAVGYREAAVGSSDPLRELLRGAGAAAPRVTVPAAGAAPEANAPPPAGTGASAPAETTPPPGTGAPPAPAETTPPPADAPAPPAPAPPPPAGAPPAR